MFKQKQKLKQGSEACLQPFQISKIECFAEIVNLLTIFGKHFILDVWQGSEYASEDHINYGNLKSV